MKKYYKVFTIDDNEKFAPVGFSEDALHYYYASEEIAIREIKRVFESKEYYDDTTYVIIPAYKMR